VFHLNLHPLPSLTVSVSGSFSYCSASVMEVPAKEPHLSAAYIMLV